MTTRHLLRVRTRAGAGIFCDPIRLPGFAWVLAACLVTGCKSASTSQYTAPRVEGRVLDAETRQPLGGVKVRRVDPYAGGASRQVPKGGQSIEKSPGVRTRP